MECAGDSNKSAKGIVLNPCRTLKLPKPKPPIWRCELAAVYYSANSFGDDIFGCSERLPDAQLLPIS